MLYGYPVEATRDNWLHTCLCLMLRTIHSRIRAGLAVPIWPDLIPVQLRPRLANRRALRNRLQEYSTELARLSAADEHAVYRAILEQNRISRLVSEGCSCSVLPQLPVGIQAPLDELSREAFRLLTDLGVRDLQYQLIFQTIRHKVCPFCGIEYFDAPGAPREDLDHYLLRSRYPFAGANLRNLVPMGSRCNSAYKGTTDILWNGATRRKAFNPYGPVSVSISLAKSAAFGGTRSDYPSWQVDLFPVSEEAATWDTVFQIRTRYVRDILDHCYGTWLWEFGTCCARFGRIPATADELVEVLETYRDVKRAEGLSDRAFLKTAVLDMLIKHCQDGNQRLIRLLISVIETA